MATKLERTLNRFQPEVDRELEAVLGNSDLPLYDMIRYHLGWIDEKGCPRPGRGGKGIRATLCLLACQGVGGDWPRALPAAAAVELVHNFSLVHDDIEDRSPRRRGRATVWRVWGQPQAINVGDAMHTLARLALLRLEQNGVEPRAVLQATVLLDEACLKLCQGQYLDLDYEARPEVSVDDYLKMIEFKTAALFRASLMIGGLVGAGDQAAIERLGDFGQALGLAFQVQDDLLGIWGQEQVTGKSAASDLWSRKKTLPAVYALGRAEGLRGVYRKEALEEADVSLALSILEGTGACEYTQEMARRLHQEALGHLDKAALASPAGEELRALAAYLVERSR